MINKVSFSGIMEPQITTNKAQDTRMLIKLDTMDSESFSKRFYSFYDINHPVTYPDNVAYEDNRLEIIKDEDGDDCFVLNGELENGDGITFTIYKNSISKESKSLYDNIKAKLSELS